MQTAGWRSQQAVTAVGPWVDQVEAVSSLTERVCLDPLQQLRPRLPSAGSRLFSTLCGARPELGAQGSRSFHRSCLCGRAQRTVRDQGLAGKQQGL